MSIVHEGALVLPSAPKCRQLLLLFLFRVNSIVTVDDCLEELWSEALPKTALSTLQTYVLQIRRALRRLPGTGRGLVTHNSGYLFAASPESVDHVVFRRLADEARLAVRRGEDTQASARFSEALGLWRGEAGADVRLGPLTSAHRAELAEARLGALEQRIEADLRLGRHDDLLEELDFLTARHPRHENISAQYMIALSRSGEVTRARHAYERLREHLVAELALEPSQALQDLYASLSA